MTTLTRSTSRTTPGYKDYVNFLGAYKNGRKEEIAPSSTAPSMDVTDFSKNSCVSFNAYVESSKNKKFNVVKPNFEEKSTKRSEIFIEIHEPSKSVSEVSKMFENKVKSPKKINSKIDVFERQVSKEKPKLAMKPVLTPSTPTDLKEINITPPPPPPPLINFSSTKISTSLTNGPVMKVTTPPPPPPPLINLSSTKISTSLTNGPGKGITTPPPPPPPLINLSSTKINTSLTTVPVMKVATPPPPPPPLINLSSVNTQPPLINVTKKITTPPPPPPPMTQSVPKIQATLTKGPQIKHTVNNPNGIISNGIDRNDPMVKKLVYGTLRGLYGAYHEKANDMMATLPRDRVKKSNGVQDIIEKIASNGDLDKLNGRINPKSEQE